MYCRLLHDSLHDEPLCLAAHGEYMGNNPNRYIFRCVLLQLPATGDTLPSTESAECEDDNNWRKKLSLELESWNGTGFLKHYSI